jgi:hypothetical protein
VAAVRSSGITLLGGPPASVRDSKAVWVQQTSYAAGAEEPQPAQLIIHTLLVDAWCRPRLSDDIVQVSDAIYRGFLVALGRENENP